YIQMVLDESLYKRRLSMLTDQINKALDEKDKDAFLTLSKEYAALKKSE
ncbi:IDEAL domain-containing protein, partial [Bacillus sp. S10C12M]|nr:IDEAL domain-containing protein [Bacillus sp. S10C12M]